MPDTQKTLGFIGTGTIAQAFIEGLVASGKTNPVLLSPRSEAVSSSLCEQFPHVRRATSNAEVAEQSEIVFLGMRPPQVEEALEGVSFRSDQIVCSFVAGFLLDDLARVIPQPTLCRVIPLPAIAACEGPVALFPKVPELSELLTGMGELVEPERETDFVAMGAVSGFMSSYYELQGTLLDWMTSRGVAPDTASTYMRALFAGLAQTSLHSDKSFAELAAEHQTKGGLNERTRKGLIEDGWFARATQAIETVQKVRREALD
ncbi:NAD(P)-binding domain-containing protein [Rhizobium halophytocola]|uniref:Pyrroline-5-carboxylate reductase n=1 Tax=Rhizobium halophytocola TaxID=735519 RepID=A0ABS4E299_9HYPH|nr:NAD(P)-binding domain-containing protein [Rhizobium halophytocola]MBP1852075.1 pyrroline-5-carboxylate reductase [Rhizobium halophytocola]